MGTGAGCGVTQPHAPGAEAARKNYGATREPEGGSAASTAFAVPTGVQSLEAFRSHGPEKCARASLSRRTLALTPSILSPGGGSDSSAEIMAKVKGQVRRFVMRSGSRAGDHVARCLRYREIEWSVLRGCLP